MKLSTKGRYGVRAMLDLALHYGQGPIALKHVAERQNISEHYLEQLVVILRRAGLVRSMRGAQGGYTLSREPGKITLGDVIRSLEGPISPVDCVSEEDPEYCSRAGFCITRGIWEKIRDNIAGILDSTTLEDMCRQAEQLARANNPYMYYI